MKPFTVHQGSVVSMDRANVDTDQIIPKQFLKRIERTGFGQFLFYDWRFQEDGSDNPQFEFNQASPAKASVLLAKRNFGCGSSREHAVWALADYGFAVIIAPSFADIFYNNCFKNGLLPIALDEATVSQLFELSREQPDLQLTVDLEQCTIRDQSQLQISFQLDGFRRECLLNGLDDIALTLQQADRIADYETQRGMDAVT
ncbi:MAG TPA: 3-isopropylmalate dehydratase small subunit [Planctomycetes bacterium]|nr:3-isopropylmalate dehydratase small subunit [Planctomycetaceae bacterium]HIN94138.1 3-isopropylmalate dehydratase small subunit [Planctomycetota bacterium]